MARVRSLLASQNCTTRCIEQTELLKEQSEQLATWNRTLEQRVAEQTAEIARIGRLERFLAPHLVQIIALSQDPDAGWRATDAKVRSYSAICAALPLSPTRPSPRRSWPCCASITRPRRVDLPARRHAGPLHRRGIMIIFNDPTPRGPFGARRAARDRNRARAWADYRRNGGSRATISASHRHRDGLCDARTGRVREAARYTATGGSPTCRPALRRGARGPDCDLPAGFRQRPGPRRGAAVARTEPQGFNRPVPAYEVLSWREDGATQILPRRLRRGRPERAPPRLTRRCEQ